MTVFNLSPTMYHPGILDTARCELRMPPMHSPSATRFVSLADGGGVPLNGFVQVILSAWSMGGPQSWDALELMDGASTCKGVLI